MKLALHTLLALTPWQPPTLPSERFEPRALQQCTEQTASRPRTRAGQRAVLAPPAARGDEIRPPKVRRGPPPVAMIAAGATLLVAGAALRFPAPMYIEMTPGTNPWSQPGARAAITSYTHSTPQIALGAAGTIVQALGASLLRHGIRAR